MQRLIDGQGYGLFAAGLRFELTKELFHKCLEVMDLEMVKVPGRAPRLVAKEKKRGAASRSTNGDTPEPNEGN